MTFVMGSAGGADGGQGGGGGDDWKRSSKPFFLAYIPDEDEEADENEEEVCSGLCVCSGVWFDPFMSNIYFYRRIQTKPVSADVLE